MKYHILNGDALYAGFLATNLSTEILIMRECLIVGDVHANDLGSFYQSRASYLHRHYQVSPDSYFRDVVPAFDSIVNAPGNSHFYLWFGYELFCQVNLWFLLWLIHQRSEADQVYLVYPSYLSQEIRWEDFGNATTENLLYCQEHKITMDKSDLAFGAELWNAYSRSDFSELKRLSSVPSTCFPYLAEVVQAHLDRYSQDGDLPKPEQTILEIMTSGSPDFETLFPIFSSKMGVYGFGDSQVREIYERVRMKEKTKR
ncbi:MAG: hypothetical protein ABI844_18455 [Saprospiraceae bacterium]